MLLTESTLSETPSEESQIHEAIHSEAVVNAMKTIEMLNRKNIMMVANAQDLTEEETKEWMENYQHWYQDMIPVSIPEGIKIDEGVLCEF